MKCPDCNGVIEGRRPFCPHCGRKMGGLLSGLTDPAKNDAAPSQTQSASSRATPNENPLSPEAIERMKRAGFSPNIDARIIRIGIMALAGGIIGSVLPGHWGWAGAFIGLFLGLRSLRKK